METRLEKRIKSIRSLPQGQFNKYRQMFDSLMKAHCREKCKEYNKRISKRINCSSNSAKNDGINNFTLSTNIFSLCVNNTTLFRELL